MGEPQSGLDSLAGLHGRDRAVFITAKMTEPGARKGPLWFAAELAGALARPTLTAALYEAHFKGGGTSPALANSLSWRSGLE